MTGGIVLILLLLAGYFTRGLLKPSAPVRLGILNELPTILGLGAVASFLFFLLASWFGDVSMTLLMLWVIFLGLLWYLFRKGDTQQQQNNPLLPIDMLAFFLLALLVTVNLSLTLYLPILDWDTRILWALKAKILTLEPTVTGVAFRDPYLLHIHPRYPLLVPFIASWAARMQGEFLETHYQALIGLFSFLTSWQLYLLLSRLTERKSALLLTFVMACTGVWITAQYNSGIEIPLTFFLLLSVNYLFEWAGERKRTDILMAGIFLFGMAMVKNEGLLLGASCVIALFVLLLRQKDILAALRSTGLLAGLFVILSSVWFAHLLMIPAVSDEQYLSRLTPSVVMSGLERFPSIMTTIMERITDLQSWHLIWLTPVAVVGCLFFRRADVDCRLIFLLVVTGCYCSGVLLVYIISPWRDIAMHINITLDRVALPLLPLFMIVLTLVGGRHSSLPEMPHER